MSKTEAQKPQPRYEWRDGQVWDIKRECWAIWACAGGGFGCGADFADILIAALNSYVDPYEEG